MAESKDTRKQKQPAAGLSASDKSAQVTDPQAQKLLRTGRAVGNDEIQRRISQGNATRDELMLFLQQRLGTLREVQLREMAATKNKDEWGRAVADSQKSDFTKPDPTRWRESARTYEEAAQQLARGSLSRGAQLIERAVEAEKKAFGSLSAVVDVKDVGGELEVDAPGALGDVAPGQGCGEGSVPAEVSQLAQEIQNVTEQVEDPAVKRRGWDPWWTLDEEEEEEKPDGAAG